MKGFRSSWMGTDRPATGRGMKAVATSLALGCGMTACSRDYTAAYLYVTNAKNSNITAYAVDYQSGALQQLSDSPIPSGGVNPVTLVAAPNGKFLYVLNHDGPSSNVVEFAVGTDGKIYAENTYPVVTGNGFTGTLPTAAAIDAAGKFLYVTFTYQNGFTAALPGPGGVAVFPVNADGTLGAAVTDTVGGMALPYVPVGFNPVGVMTSGRNNYVYVIDREQTTAGVPYGVMLAFSENPTTGALTLIPGPVAGAAVPTGAPATPTGFAAGVSPSSLAGDPTGIFIYVTDSTTNSLYAYSVVGNTPVANVANPYTTGLYPTSVKVDPRGAFVYVANFTSNTVTSYAINTATGALSGAGAGTGVATGPTCVTIEPALGIYLYTSNNTDNSISARQLDPHTGALTAVQGTVFSSQGLPTCAVAVANGAHASQIVE